jgi:vacuolar-type H+-ATPase subunit I/STV1
MGAGYSSYPLAEGVKRHEWKAAHGYRKFYKSRAEQVMKPINVEATMGHDLGISQSYWKPTEKEVLEDYLKAVDLLTINDVKSTLQKQMAELTEKSKEENYIIKGKLTEKEKEIQAAAREAEQTRRELAELKAKQEDASRKQQLEIEQIKAQLEKNADDQVGILLQALSKLQKQEVNAGTATTQAPKDFVLQKLGILTNGKIGEDPETGLIIVPPSPGEESHSKRCCICERIERERTKEQAQ